MSIVSKPSFPRGVLRHGLAPARFAPLVLAIEGVRHAFYGREGGVSTGIYASLNAGTGSKDEPEAVAENRRRIAENFGLTPEQLIGVHQVHSPIAHVVSGPWLSARAEGDALVTKTSKLALSVLTADCAPVLFADTQAGVIGAAHAGWKGAFGGVLENTISTMETLGAQRAHIVAAIGPCIAQQNYEVGPEFEARFLDADASFARFFIAGAGDRRLFDLAGFCTARLEALGLSSVSSSGIDTFADANGSFSHRRSLRENAGDYGRNCAVIMLD